ncbi:hypothetical protein P4O66_003279 [Electrophorus voltai]|uniref:Uncharacterized protein n=1 Tax=Electrophorus voltai TaxID=2609070 RepID=A0AAD8YRR6_9TELE|nr:hypothetical protein P4O66_003279 [Electrophorus voltai]
MGVSAQRRHKQHSEDLFKTTVTRVPCSTDYNTTNTLPSDEGVEVLSQFFICFVTSWASMGLDPALLDRYVRMLSVDIIFPHKLLRNLENLGLGSFMCTWVMEFLTGSPGQR